LPHFSNQHYSESTTPYSYKHLTTTDVPFLKNLLHVFGQAFNEVPTYQNTVPSDTYLQSLLAKPHFIALAAMQANEAVGGLAAYVLEKFEQDRREIYIYDLAISEPHRRKGLATSLIKILQQIAKEKNSYIIFVQADPGDDPAIRLYESLGIKESVFHFDIPVK
jgi:aminoglycoside 3-N-acetyltransferase I